MGKWHKTCCMLCAQGCGLEVYVEDNRIVKVRADKDNPRSKGYMCSKGMNIAYYQHHRDRLTHPLKKTGNTFEQISWDQAATEIAGRIKDIVDKHGPRSFAYMGGGGQSCHFEAAFGVRLMRSLGSRYHYSALAQELTGCFWAWGRATGRQYLFGIPDENSSDMLVAIGWNGMQSHQMPRAPLVLKEFSKNPDKLLVVIDPRKSETAAIADIHLPIRPGTDALLTKAMIAIILKQQWHNKDYIDDHISGLDEIMPLFASFDARAAIDVCGLDYEQVEEVCALMGRRKWSMHTDLGVYMNRHSTAASYLHIILLGICGRICVPGGNVIPGHLMPLGSHCDERDQKNWKTVSTGFPAIMGVFPPNVMPEEIMSDHPERLRAVLCCQSNPLRSYADTGAYEEAFKRLDLLVTCELAMTETARLSDYVLPARSGYESWDAAFFAFTFPEVYFQMRRPILEPEGDQLELSEIHVRIADKLGLIPEIPKALYQAAKADHMTFGIELMNFIQAEPSAMKSMPFVLAKTLGRETGSVNLASLWGLLQSTPKSFRKNAERAGFKPGLTMGEDIFNAIIDHPEGINIGISDIDANFDWLKTQDKHVHIYAPEMDAWIRDINAESEEHALKPDPDFPLILNAGRHMKMNANSIMRDPSWNRGKRACTCLMNPEDAATMRLSDGQTVRVITEAGQCEIELETSDQARRGQVIVPHGFGLEYNGRTYGANVNRLTKNTHRDRFAATPLHRYVLCRVEPVG